MSVNKSLEIVMPFVQEVVSAMVYLKQPAQATLKPQELKGVVCQHILKLNLGLGEFESGRQVYTRDELLACMTTEFTLAMNKIVNLSADNQESERPILDYCDRINAISGRRHHKTESEVKDDCEFHLFTFHIIELRKQISLIGSQIRELEQTFASYFYSIKKRRNIAKQISDLIETITRLPRMHDQMMPHNLTKTTTPKGFYRHEDYEKGVSDIQGALYKIHEAVLDPNKTTHELIVDLTRKIEVVWE